MATKMEELKSLAAGVGTLHKILPDEPIFILRARDMLAPDVVEFWANRLVAEGSMDPKVREARALAHQMRAWQELNTKKVPD